jgi:hypothetical protein
MPNQPATETELLRAAYAAFNARDIDVISSASRVFSCSDFPGTVFTMIWGIVFFGVAVIDGIVPDALH